MIRNRIAAFGLLATLLVVSFSFAQKPSGPPDPAMMVQHRVEFLTKSLGLSAEQQQNATTIFTNAANTMTGIHGSMEAAHDSLNTAVKNNDVNGISQAANTIGNLTAQMVSIHAKADAAFYQTLTPDQQAKFNDFEGRHHMGPMGPMMFHGMHPEARP